MVNYDKKYCSNNFDISSHPFIRYIDISKIYQKVKGLKVHPKLFYELFIVQTLRTNELKSWTVLSTEDILYTTIVQTFELTNFKVWTVLSAEDI